ncbi:MAG TPA: DUF1269 domain-containing protein [Burkholderiales bacterium]|jgi:hypothetical protein
MRRRLYFILPDVDSARRTADDLLLARIDDRHMHFLARRGTDLGELREAGYLMKTDALHGAGVGAGLGALGGLLLGAAMLLFPIAGTRPHPGIPFIAVLAGCLLGAWIASMVGSSVPNSRLSRFARDIEAGRVLMMVDVPFGRADSVRQIVTARHPEAVPAGQVRPYLVFP